MNHIVLLGDSIFDNGIYVPGEPSVIAQVQSELPDWKATLLARDGDTTRDITEQLRAMPDDASHLVVSTGGNDALGQIDTLLAPANSMDATLNRLADIREHFEQDYRAMLNTVLRRRLPTAVCTIYESIPGLDRRLHAALCLFNDVIIREANRTQTPVIDIRLICTEPEDYSVISPIEPSSSGGRKIAREIAVWAKFKT